MAFFKRHINSMTMVLTNQCNLACPCCYENKHPANMSLDVAKQCVKFLDMYSNGSPINICYFGGEPLLVYNDVIKPLHKWILNNYECRVKAAMTTNGTLITDEIAEFIRNNGVGLLLSCDGNKASQDVNRPYKDGRGSYDDVIAASEILTKHNVRFSTRMTMTNEILPYLFDCLISLEQFTPNMIKILPNSFATFNENDIKVITEQLLQYEDYVVSVFSSGVKCKMPEIYKECFTEIGMIKSAETSGIERCCFSCDRHGYCGTSANGLVAANTNGDLFTCHRVLGDEHNEFYIGNVFDGIVEDKVDSLITSIDGKSPDGVNCSQCKLRKVCHGDCITNNYNCGNGLTNPTNSFCVFQNAFFDSAQRIYDKLTENHNLTFNAYLSGVIRR